MWAERQARLSTLQTFAYNGRTPPDLTPLAETVERLFNQGEDLQSLDEYKKCVLSAIQAK